MFPSDQCGVPGPSSRITGGDESPPHKYPWMASLFMKQVRILLIFNAVGCLSYLSIKEGPKKTNKYINI
jgi:hypothetical protein